MSYTYGGDVTYVTNSGVVLTADQVRARMRVGAPVVVHYAPHGETRVIKRIVVQDHDDDDDDDD